MELVNEGGHDAPRPPSSAARGHPQLVEVDDVVVAFLPIPLVLVGRRDVVVAKSLHGDRLGVKEAGGFLPFVGAEAHVRAIRQDHLCNNARQFDSKEKERRLSVSGTMEFDIRA